MEKLIEQMEARFTRALLLGRAGIKTIFYDGAAAEARQIVDDLLRPHSNEEGVKAIDAYRYYHDRKFIPASWVVMSGGAPAIPCSLNDLLETSPNELFHPNDWGNLFNWPHFDRLRTIYPFITHYWSHGGEWTVYQFLHATRKTLPQYYLRVLEKLVEELEKKT